MSDSKMNKVVETYLKIRDERNRLTREYDAKDKELAADLASIEQVLLTSCNDIGADSIRTELGTVIKSTRESFVCGDWDNFKKFILDNEAVELLQQRIHQSNFKEFLSGREDEGLPPGISSMREFKITVRKPSK
jgi:hypothetical protein|tara:strand:+ start:106 stop:507 length:402 start_codon:yes stop_codon:yes gene_type:complete